ncbi:MAG: hypothetical protein JJE09_06305, partial [Bacteroidia bacterium]|nr:hypothetical protein [Bacteroidia bacterium]
MKEQILLKYLLSIFITLLCLNSFSQEKNVGMKPAQVAEVAVFIGLECPITQKYIYRLNDIYKQYGNISSLRWSFIVPGKAKRKS